MTYGLNQKTGKHHCLPTEAEWEYAARGGNKSNGYSYSGSNTMNEVAWCDDNSGGKVHVKGEKQANELGIYDMSGNVWEWCQDWFAADYYANSPSINPQGPQSGTARVRRGSCWDDSGFDSTVSCRNSYSPGDSANDIGFRLVLVP